MNEVEQARERFFEAVRKVNQGEIDEDQPIPGAHGEVEDSTEAERE